jgi:hypothetical protein
MQVGSPNNRSPGLMPQHQYRSAKGSQYRGRVFWVNRGVLEFQLGSRQLTARAHDCEVSNALVCENAQNRATLIFIVRSGGAPGADG